MMIYPAHTRRKTFIRFIEVEAWKYPELSDIQPVMKGINDACRGIASLVRRAQIDEIAGMHGAGTEVNIQGEVQKVRDQELPSTLTSTALTPRWFVAAWWVSGDGCAGQSDLNRFHVCPWQDGLCGI